ncbi:hypothetical protein JB92DRAFT_3190659, partial [Gautieria morchelliformis]
HNTLHIFLEHESEIRTISPGDKNIYRHSNTPMLASAEMPWSVITYESVGGSGLVPKSFEEEEREQADQDYDKIPRRRSQEDESLMSTPVQACLQMLMEGRPEKTSRTLVRGSSVNSTSKGTSVDRDFHPGGSTPQAFFQLDLLSRDDGPEWWEEVTELDRTCGWTVLICLTTRVEEPDPPLRWGGNPGVVTLKLRIDEGREEKSPRSEVGVLVPNDRLLGLKGSSGCADPLLRHLARPPRTEPTEVGVVRSLVPFVKRVVMDIEAPVEQEQAWERTKVSRRQGGGSVGSGSGSGSGSCSGSGGEAAAAAPRELDTEACRALGFAGTMGAQRPQLSSQRDL